jgi:hypothetical protein
MPGIFNTMRRTGRRRFIESYEFSPALRTKLTAELGSAHAADVALAGLRGWYLACLHADNRLIGMPSKAVDEAWHEMILMTREYTLFCDRGFGRYLHHTPDSVMTGVSMDDITAETLAIVDKHHIPMTLFSADADAGIEDASVWRASDLRRLRDANKRRDRDRKRRRQAGATSGFAGGYVASDGSSGDSNGWSFFGFGGGGDGGGGGHGGGGHDGGGGGSSCGGGGCGGGGCGGGG